MFPKIEARNIIKIYVSLGICQNNTQASNLFIQNISNLFSTVYQEIDITAILNYLGLGEGILFGPTQKDRVLNGFYNSKILTFLNKFLPYDLTLNWCSSKERIKYCLSYINGEFFDTFNNNLEENYYYRLQRLCISFCPGLEIGPGEKIFIFKNFQDLFEYFSDLLHFHRVCNSAKIVAEGNINIFIEYLREAYPTLISFGDENDFYMKKLFNNGCPSLHNINFFLNNTRFLYLDTLANYLYWSYCYTSPYSTFEEIFYNLGEEKTVQAGNTNTNPSLSAEEYLGFFK
jgi:hypothetical protein